MRIKHPAAQVAVLIVASMLVAVIANGFAGRTRRLVLPGWYPNALKVPPREVPATTTATTTTTTAVAPTATIAETATTAQSPAPGQPPIVIPTTTIERPAGTPAPQHPGTPAPQQPSTPATQQPSNPATPSTILARFTPHPDKPYIEISGEDAAALHAAGALFLDARRTAVYEQGHIAGARAFSVWEADVDDKVNSLFEERSDPESQNKPIVVYCSGGACEDSHMLSQKLWGLQFNNVYVYKDGYPDWQKRNGAVRTGATP